MKYSGGIDGIAELMSTLPEELQHWHKFGNIEELSYRKVPGDEDCGYVRCIEMLLTDIRKEYAIKLELYNVTGSAAFDIPNGFGSGLTVDDCSEWGYEKASRFRISSREQGNEFELYCERIKAEVSHL